MRTTHLFSIIMGLTACVLSQSLWAVRTCNNNIIITKPDSIYIDHLDGTVSDIETGLMWQKCAYGRTWNKGSDASDGNDDSCDGSNTPRHWYYGLHYALDDTSYGYSDWRLPNRKELESLLELACHNPAINDSLFPGTALDRGYNTSTPHPRQAGYAWSVDFTRGTHSAFPTYAYQDFRFVRN